MIRHDPTPTEKARENGGLLQNEFFDMARLIFSLGSNNDQERNIMQAQQSIATMLADVAYSPLVWTEPIGMKTNNLFLNCLGVADTRYAFNQLRHAFKRIERRQGDSHGLRTTGCVRIDIDILEYNNTRYHEADWNRPFMKELLAQLPSLSEEEEL